MTWLRTADDATAEEHLQNEALHDMLGQIRTELRLNDADDTWEGYAAVYLLRTGDADTRLDQVDLITYTPGQDPGHAIMARYRSAPAAIRFITAAAHGRPFDQAVVAVTYRRDTRDMRADLFWDGDADPYLVDPHTWHTIAAALNPFRP